MHLQGALHLWGLCCVRTRILPGQEGFFAELRPVDQGPREQSRLGDVLAATLWHASEHSSKARAAAVRSLSVAEAATSAGLPEAELLRLIETGLLSALRVDEEWRIPDWQFGEQGQLIAGISSIIRAFAGSTAALAAWVEREHPDLGLTPRAALLEGRVDEVVYAANRGTNL